MSNILDYGYNRGIEADAFLRHFGDSQALGTDGKSKKLPQVKQLISTALLLISVESRLMIYKQGVHTPVIDWQ